MFNYLDFKLTKTDLANIFRINITGRTATVGDLTYLPSCNKCKTRPCSCVVTEDVEAGGKWRNRVEMFGSKLMNSKNLGKFMSQAGLNMTTGAMEHLLTDKNIYFMETKLWEVRYDSGILALYNQLASKDRKISQKWIETLLIRSHVMVIEATMLDSNFHTSVFEEYQFPKGIQPRGVST